MRILIIEDDEKIAGFVKRGLQEAGFAVDHAANGRDGLHLALHEAYDAAVIDLMLPQRRRPLRHPGDAQKPAPDPRHRPQRQARRG